MTEDQKRPTLEVPFCGCVFLGKWRSSSESTVPTVLTAEFVQSLEFLKKSWNLSNYFPDLEKVWKRWSLEKMRKSHEFFFSNLQQVLYKWIFSFLFFFNHIQPLPHVCRAPRKKLCSYVLRSLLITCLITLSLEKEIVVLEKVLEEVHPALRVTSFFICFFFFSIVPHACKDGGYRK